MFAKTFHTWKPQKLKYKLQKAGHFEKTVKIGLNVNEWRP